LSTADPTAAEPALQVLRSAPDHGFDPARSGAPALTDATQALAHEDASAPGHLERVADLDARITAALLTFGRDVATGTLSPTRVNGLWKMQRDAPDVGRALVLAADGDVRRFVAAVQPQHQQYAALVEAMHRLREERAHGTSTLDNAATARRIRQVALNLERWRWMRDDFGSRDVLVNIPALRLYIREKGHVIDEIKVVVGKPDGHQTPVLSSIINTIVFSPYWNIPYGIGQEETAVAAGNNPAYLTNKHIEVLRNGKVMNEGEINWFDPKDLKGLMFRQAPGSENALGRVKFLFPNPYSVYLHDTPDDGPFGDAMRALSHGCVRVEAPERLASYVLRGETDWTSAKIEAAMAAGRERHVKLREPISVHLVYFTAWVDERGALTFPADIYGYDARQLGASGGRRR
jgi:murein L,D-transpeptidase YcbB/YkuD